MMSSISLSSGFDEQDSLRVFSILRKLSSSRVSFSSPKDETSAAGLPSSSVETRRRSIGEIPFTSEITSTLLTHPDSSLSQETVLYLAYGSNLSAETFKSVRGIKPLSSMNVLVPTLELSFDLAGIPYTEPCFANTRIRNPRDWDPRTPKPPYHKNRWNKGLIGVVYEVTKADYATIIATEGGGASYQDIVVPCFELPAGMRGVNPFPTTTPFKAHTLFQPAPPPGTKPNWTLRPDPDYAQASARYLKLIIDGAEEHRLPNEYLNYLRHLEPYTITSKRQKMGKLLFSVIWMPIILAILTLSKMFADDKGRSPAWAVVILGWAFSAVWASYDLIFKPVFGDGERTQEPEDKGESWPDEKKASMNSNLSNEV